VRHLKALEFIDTVARVGSIRKAAEQLAITSTALNRRVLAIEEELGVPIFERLPGGVRLSTAGELFLQYARDQLADAARLRSRIADLSGERRGHVNIAGGQACLQNFLPALIAEYRRDHPDVTFSLRTCDRFGAELALSEYRADIVVLHEAEWSPSLRIVAEQAQRIHLLCHESHPLASHSVVRLRDCLQYPVALPTQSNGVRLLLERAAARLRQPLPVAIESDNFGCLSHCLADGEMLSFQIAIALDETVHASSLRQVPVDVQDLPGGRLCAGHLRDRTLPVAASRFLERLVQRWSG